MTSPARNKQTVRRESAGFLLVTSPAWMPFLYLIMLMWYIHLSLKRRKKSEPVATVLQPLETICSITALPGKMIGSQMRLGLTGFA